MISIELDNAQQLVELVHLVTEETKASRKVNGSEDELSDEEKAYLDHLITLKDRLWSAIRKYKISYISEFYFGNVKRPDLQRDWEQQSDYWS